MSQADLIIRNGTIIDGSGGPEIVSDILIKDGFIEKLNQSSMRFFKKIKIFF